MLMNPGPGGPTTYGSGSATLTDKELKSEKIRENEEFGKGNVQLTYLCRLRSRYSTLMSADRLVSILGRIGGS